MEILEIICIFALIILCIGFASAGYYLREPFSRTTTQEKYFDYPDRGMEYFRNDYTRYNRPEKSYHQPQPSHYLKYYPAMDAYQVKECYHHPPKGRLFYFKCP